MKPDCDTCKWNAKSPYDKGLDKCYAEGRDCVFSQNERNAGNCGWDAALYVKRTSKYPRIQKLDYIIAYMPVFLIIVFSLMTMYTIYKFLIA